MRYVIFVDVLEVEFVHRKEPKLRFRCGITDFFIALFVLDFGLEQFRETEKGPQTKSFKIKFNSRLD